MNVTLESKSILQQKEENQKIDTTLQVTSDNPFKTNVREKLKKKEHQERVQAERKGNKLSRNLTALYIKMCRNKRAK